MRYSSQLVLAKFKLKNLNRLHFNLLVCIFFYKYLTLNEQNS